MDSQGGVPISLVAGFNMVSIVLSYSGCFFTSTSAYHLGTIIDVSFWRTKFSFRITSVARFPENKITEAFVFTFLYLFHHNFN